MSRVTILLLLALTVNVSTANAADWDIVPQPGVGPYASVVDSLPRIYMPHTPGARIPRGWKCITIEIPYTETCFKTVCEEQIVQVPKQVPCTVCKQIQVPIEVYKTYVKFKEIRVEDGVFVRRDDAPESELDDLERESDGLKREIDGLERKIEELERKQETLTSNRVDADASSNRVITVSNRTPPAVQNSDSTSLESGLLTPDGFERVPVTKVRQKRIQVKVPVTQFVEVDEGCWKEISVAVPCQCGNVPSCSDGTGCRILGHKTPKRTTNVRRVWEPLIVQREVTVLETRDVMVDETYTEYVLQPRPKAQPDVAPDVAPDAAPDVAPEPQPDVAPEDVLVTEDRPVLVPQYVTKAERHYITKTITVPSTKTIFVPVKQIVQREVPYEVCRTETRQVLVPINPHDVMPMLVPQSQLLPQPHLHPHAVGSSVLEPALPEPSASQPHPAESKIELETK